MKVFVAGFQHETNTFAPTKADWAAFGEGSSFGPRLRGAAMLEFYRGKTMPVSGFIAAAERAGWSLLPSLWTGTDPSAHVTKDAFARIADAITQDLREALSGERPDAVYLDLHGAAVSEDADDAEGELLERLRAIAGPDLPIVCSLDLHANVTRRMLALADGLVAYRTYPHIDMVETGALAAGLLERRMTRGRREPLAVRRLDFLLPINAQSTMMEPAGSIYRDLVHLEAEHGASLSFAMGFPAADFPECGPVLWGYGDGAPAAVDALFARIDRREAWRTEFLPPERAVAEAMALAATAERPVVIADTQDNPGAGGDGNTAGLLHALLDLGAGRRFPAGVALSPLADPAVAGAAHAAGLGATLELEALGRAVPTWNGLSDPPVRCTAVVRMLSDGAVALKGPMSMSGSVSLGPSACLEIEGVLVVVSSRKTQTLDRELFRHFGIAPEAMRILVVKSSVHFRADFAPIASRILVAKAPGPMAADPGDLPWTRLPPTMDVRP